MGTTYVFGAGASCDVGYPLASEMGDGLLDFMVKPPDLRIRASGEFLTDTFGKSPNVEDLITELQSRIGLLKDAPSLVRAHWGRFSAGLDSAAVSGVHFGFFE